MSIEIDHLLPTLGQSLDGIGFLFGAGTSAEAGYPMMAKLTRDVVAGLAPSHRTALDQVLVATGHVYDDKTATPNIEVISDLTIAYAINSGDPNFKALEERFRELIVERLLSVSSPVLDHHVRFFEGLRSRTFGLPCTVWIFTTNYDLMFETAASLAGVHLENGFAGATTRFFDIAQLTKIQGTSDGQRFQPSPSLTVKLIKLHGSMSWTTSGGRLLEQHPGSLDKTTPRVVVLPRRRKVFETLARPYDQLFSQASRVLGVECKYLLSCGFSFGDEHINETLLLPVLRAGRCRMSVVCEIEPDGFAPFRSLSTVQGAFSNGSWMAGSASADTTDLWRFSKLAAAF